MKTVLKISKVVNIIALLFLFLGIYGLPFTGFLQVIAAILIFAVRPKERLLWVYFGIVIAFFCTWDYKIIQWQWIYIVPPSLILLLTYIIHFKKFK